jgi:hypothetical protein
MVTSQALPIHKNSDATLGNLILQHKQQNFFGGVCHLIISTQQNYFSSSKARKPKLDIHAEPCYLE